MFISGADVAKIATTAQHIEDTARVLALPARASGVLSCQVCMSWYLLVTLPVSAAGMGFVSSAPFLYGAFGLGA